MKLKKYINTVVQLLVLVTLLNCSSDDDSTEPNLAPEAFDLLTVTNNTTDVTVLPVFTWNTSSDPDGDIVTYDFIIDTNANPTTIIASDLTETFFVTTSRFNASKTYFWKVIAKDGKGGQTESEIFTFSTKDLRIERLTNNANFSPRREHTSVSFNSKVWVIGGVSSSNNLLNDVWNSSDGITWQEVTNSTGYPARSHHSSVVFNDKIWIIGGHNFGLLNDVWNSSDGINWVLVKQQADFSKRFDHASVVFNNKIWVIGGKDSNDRNDVWSSSDGINWTEENSNASFPPTSAHTVSVFNNKMWLVFGIEIWNSDDGVLWTEVVNPTPFSHRTNHTSVVFDDAIFLIAGDNGGVFLNDIQKTEDGVNWEILENTTNNGLLFPRRASHTSIVHNNQLLIIGGKASFGGNTLLNDVFAIE